MPKKTDDGMIYLSPSSLQRWYEVGCPARWKLEKEFEPKEKDEFAERGILVHSMMEGTVSPGVVEDKLALSFYARLDLAYKTAGLRTLASEVRQSFPILPDVMWVRRIDRIALLPDDTPVIIDFKTTGAIWKELGNGIIPQSLASQSPGYLLRPAGGLWEQTKWPTTILYLIVGFRGPASFVRYDYSPELQENFLEAVKLARDSILRNQFPKIYGKHCLDCKMAAACFQDPNWKRKYKRRRG